MGLSFSGFRKELSSYRFQQAYQDLRKKCPALFPYADTGSLIAFFRDPMEHPDSKNVILFELIACYQKDKRQPDFSPLFIVIFSPALTNLYAAARKRCPHMDRADLIQDICLLFIQTIGNIKLTPDRMAGRIIGELRNRVRTLLNMNPDENLIALDGDGHGDFVIPSCAAETNTDEEIDSDDIVAEISLFLDRLMRTGKITRKDKRIIMDTITEGKSLKDIAPPRDYDRLKHRRRQMIEFMRKKYSASS
jgi:hypothetical protein